MKRTISFTILLITTFYTNLFAQWIDKSGGNNFDGHYQSIEIQGEGDYPYSRPTMEYVLWGSGGNILNNSSYLSIEGIGYTGCGNNYIELSVNGENYKMGAIYGNNVLSNDNNDGIIIRTGFRLRSVDGTKNISICELVSKSFNTGPLYLRVRNDCYSKTFVFRNTEYTGNAEIISSCNDVQKRHKKQINVLISSLVVELLILASLPIFLT
jgi:hypothetical protein